MDVRVLVCKAWRGRVGQEYCYEDDPEFWRDEISREFEPWLWRIIAEHGAVVVLLDTTLGECDAVSIAPISTAFGISETGLKEIARSMAEATTIDDAVRRLLTLTGTSVVSIRGVAAHYGADITLLAVL